MDVKLGKLIQFPQKPRPSDPQARACEEATALLTDHVNRLYNSGYDSLTILSAIIVVCGRVLAKVDPMAEKVDGRDYVFQLINKYADEQIISDLENK
jgi:hypothetical protein